MHALSLHSDEARFIPIVPQLVPCQLLHKELDASRVASHCHVGDLLHWFAVDMIDVRLRGVNLNLTCLVGIYMTVFINRLGVEAATNNATLYALEGLDDGDVE